MEQAADTRRHQLPFHNGTPIGFAPSGGGPMTASQTLDHHNSVHQLPGLQHRKALTIRPYEFEIDKDSNPDPLSFAFSPVSVTPSPPPLSGAVRYRECLRNHAASVGGNVTDGCCEFMPSGEDGTLEALKCAACKCHRNFHRKDFEDGHGGRSQAPRLLLPPPHARYATVSPTPVSMAYGGGGTDQSSSEDVDGATLAPAKPEYMAASTALPGFMTKKRNRTKFTKEQKEKMWEFAERLGWRIQGQNDEEVDGFCESIAVRRQVFKVWMHNNKNNNSKIISYDLAARIQQLPGSDPEPDHIVGHNAEAAATVLECTLP